MLLWWSKECYQQVLSTRRVNRAFRVVVLVWSSWQCWLGRRQDLPGFLSIELDNWWTRCKTQVDEKKEPLVENWRKENGIHLPTGSDWPWYSPGEKAGSSCNQTKPNQTKPNTWHFYLLEVFALQLRSLESFLEYFHQLLANLASPGKQTTCWSHCHAWHRRIQCVGSL